MLIGITGGSGCGKSVVSERFKRLGIPVMDADGIAREVTLPNSAAVLEIARTFGSEYIAEDGSLLRKKLGGYVFSDRAALDKLNEIMRKYILRAIHEKMSAMTGEYLVFDAPLLIEYGMDSECDKVIAVLADRETRAARICKRDGISKEDAQNRIASQNDDGFYIEKADFVIYNNSDTAELDKAVKKITDALNITKKVE